MAKTKKPSEPSSNGEPKPRRATAPRRRKAEPGAGAVPTLPAAAGPPNGPGPSASPSAEQIARRAYEIFCERGGTHGYHLEDWLQAERELRSRNAPL